MTAIEVSGGGTLAVVTEDLLQAQHGLDAFAQRAQAAHDGLGVALAASLSIRAAAAAQSLAIARDELAQAGSAAQALRSALQRAAEGYGAAEQSATVGQERLGALAAALLGKLAPLGLLLAGELGLPTLGGLALAEMIAFLFTGDLMSLPRAGLDWLRGHQGLLRQPRVVSLVRQMISSADNGALAALGVPYPLARAADDPHSGLFGLQGITSAVLDLAPGRLLSDTDETVYRVPGEGTATAPDAWSQLAMRVPSNGADGAQVRVERYDQPDGARHWLVYVGGTIDPGFVPAGEPWDDTSNLEQVAGRSSASARATVIALREAGVQPGDEVVPIGYSQGGLVATGLVLSGAFATPALVTFGSPTAGAKVPSTVTDVAVEHSDDLVPALGGEPRSPKQGGGQRIVVSSRSYDGPLPLAESPFAAHHLPGYVATAEQMDASSDPRLDAARDQLRAFTGGAPAQVSLWRSDRLDATGADAAGLSSTPDAAASGGGTRGPRSN